MDLTNLELDFSVESLKVEVLLNFALIVEMLYLAKGKFQSWIVIGAGSQGVGKLGMKTDILSRQYLLSLG